MLARIVSSVVILVAVAVESTATPPPPYAFFKAKAQVLGTDKYPDQAFVVQFTNVRDKKVSMIEVKNGEPFEVDVVKNKGEDTYGYNYLTIYSLPRKVFHKLKADDPKLTTLSENTPGLLTTRPGHDLHHSGFFIYQVRIENGKLSVSSRPETLPKP